MSNQVSGLLGLVLGLNEPGKSPEQFINELLDGFNGLFPTNVGGNMQKKLNGTQLRMKRYRGMKLAQALGDLNGKKLAKDSEKRLTKLARQGLRSRGVELTPKLVKLETARLRQLERAHAK